MKVRDIMERDLITVGPGATYEEVAKCIYDKCVSGVTVTDGDGKLLGFVSEKDIFRVLYPFYKDYYEHPEYYSDLESRELKVVDIRKSAVSTFMTAVPVTVGPDEPVMKVGALMLARKVTRIPVVENGKVMGIISRKMIYRAILKKYLLEVYSETVK